MPGPLGHLADSAKDAIEASGYVGVGVLIALANVIPPVPVEVILLLAGFLSGEGRLWFPLVFLSATAGSVVGALALYTFGYWLGEARVRALVKRFGRFLLLKESDLDRAHRWFDRHGGKAIVIGRMVPGARKVIPVPVGVARMPVVWFVAYVALGSVLSNSILIGSGWLLGDQWEVVRRYAHLLEYAVLVAVIAAVVAMTIAARRIPIQIPRKV
ncbi:MAG: DedA family protein, partial [Actinomycetota bacterium]|nr:DedA family protein [Actinomycetota bacterium]